MYYIGCSKSIVSSPDYTEITRVLTGETEFHTNCADGPEWVFIAKRYKLRILCLHAYILYPLSIKIHCDI